ncbi:MAG TPA: GDP-L-fucose synthase [Desulfobacteraceae bacterium]|nr:GDP-L-fucose synthase [Desulfobacteraceae bacterium]HPJ68585.1 GDP-L-fucose synthase [Desulfobacteraceae bacterium]HPQ27414.1 GDP-L-fucose synthase [Desulfobacteraceae bacterium]
MNKDSKIYVAGHLGLVGSAIHRKLQELGYGNLLCRSEQELDLMRQERVEEFFDKEKPEYVFLAAAKVGGVLANSTFPAEFIYNNLAIQTNIIHSSYRSSVKKLLFLGSSCIYPRECPQPMKEGYLLSGYLEQTNEPYAVAKIAGIKMCQSYNRQYGTCFISVMPTNLYGQNDNFNLETSHVLPAMIRKFHEAKTKGLKEVEIWGTGTPKREFLYVDDLADACVFLMNNYNDSEIVNIGVGKDLTILDLAKLIARVVGFEGSIRLDPDKPDGTLVKRLDVSKLTQLGWKAGTSLEEGITRTYEWYLDKLLSSRPAN